MSAKMIVALGSGWVVRQVYARHADAGSNQLRQGAAWVNATIGIGTPIGRSRRLDLFPLEKIL